MRLRRDSWRRIDPLYHKMLAWKALTSFQRSIALCRNEVPSSAQITEATNVTRPASNMSMRRILVAMAAVLAASSANAQDPAPLADHHQHLFSPALAALVSPAPPATPLAPLGADDLIALLDAAGIKRAVVLSTAYIWEQGTRNVDNPADKLRADNDWTSQQVAKYPDRLIGFCGINPLKDYALDELARCAKDPNLRNGLKMHFGNSGVDYHNAQHIERLRRVFRAANGYHMPIVVHMRASFSLELPYGRDEAHIFLDELVPEAPDVVIQIAHMAGGGAPGDQLAEQALDALSEAMVKADPRTKLLYFDASGMSAQIAVPEEAARLATRMRQIGLERILFGSDGATGGNAPPREAWTAFRNLPLTEAEFRAIAVNVPPYLRK
jgi:predicted TIM-barrel fold metal-dependent hydrolase